MPDETQPAPAPEQPQPEPTPQPPTSPTTPKPTHSAAIAVAVVAILIVLVAVGYLWVNRPKPVSAPAANNTSQSNVGSDAALNADDAAVTQGLSGMDSDLNTTDQGINDKQGNLSE